MYSSSLSVVFSIWLLSMVLLCGTSVGNNIKGDEVITFEYGTKVTIASPNYPNNYPNNANNSLLFSGPLDYQIRVSFRTFHIERNYDVLRIGSGLDPSNVTSLLVSLSGSSLPDDVISSSNEMWLVFTSDGSVTDRGFVIIITVFTPGDMPDRDDESEVITFENESSVTIVSPNYPANYPNDANTQWLVSGPPEYLITAVFETFHLERGSFDTLRIGSGLDPSNVTSVLVSLSGSSLPDNVISSSNEMWLVFTSDGSVTDRGFVIIITVFTPGDMPDLGNEPEVITFEYGDFVTIVSPNYPANYPNEANTQWLVAGPADYQIMAVFRTFHVETFYDVLEIGSGLDPSNWTSLLASLSDPFLPNGIVSTSNKMWLVFTSDSTFTEQGFWIDISVFIPRNYSDLCNETAIITFEYGDSVTIVSPNYPANYPNNTSTQWLVSGPPDNQIMAVFKTFHVETFYDLLEIGSGLDPSNWTSLLASLSGPSLPNVIVSTNNKMWLVFTSDSIVTEQGFSIDISVFTTRIYSVSTDDFLYDKCLVESCTDEETTVCRCDVSCQSFGDCCYDYIGSYCEDIPTNENVTNETVMQPINLDQWECIKDSILPRLYPDHQYGYWMISRCPSEWSLDDYVKRQCEDNRDNGTPDVIYFNENGVYFRNLGCSICHGFENSSLTGISFSVNPPSCWFRDNNTMECITQLPLSQFNISTNITDIELFSSIQAVPKPRLCLIDQTTICPDYDCPAFIPPLLGVIDIFLPEMDVPDYVGDLIQPSQCEQGLDGSRYCAPASSHLPVCQSKYIWVTQTCSSEDYLEDLFCFRQLIIDEFTLSFESALPCLLSTSTFLFNDTVTFSFVYEDGIDPSLETIQDDIIRRVQTPRRDQSKNITISAAKSCNVEDNAGNMTDHCSEEVFTGHYLDFTLSLSNNESLVFSNGTYIRPRWWSNITHIDFSSANLSSKYQFILCGTEVALQTCSFFVVSNDSVEWINEENWSGIFYQGQMYDTENAFLNPDGSIRICYVDQGSSIGRRALLILGHVSFAISSVCLFATLTIYLAFSQLRNRQGVSIMNFIIALFVGQILLQYVRLSVSPFIISCIVIAALSHFFFLASFVWTTIIAWDLSRCLAANKIRIFTSSSFDRKMMAFLLVGWGVPLMFVLITLVLQFGGFWNGPNLEYDNRTCWLAKLASIVMFFIPMSLCLLSNVVLFIITIHGVHSTKKATSMLKEGQESQFKQSLVELKIYVKISALLGFCWLFGFLTMVMNVPFMDYLFVIVVGLQGVFILMSFGVNKRVRTLWRASTERSTLRTTLSRKLFRRRARDRSSTAMTSESNSNKLSTTK